MFRTKVVEEIKTHLVFNDFFLNHAIYEIIWKNFAEQGRSQMTIWRMRIACWMTKTTNIVRICNTYGFSTATMVTPTRPIVTL
jgi:hypothetical protein